MLLSWDNLRVTGQVDLPWVPRRIVGDTFVYMLMLRVRYGAYAGCLSLAFPPGLAFVPRFLSQVKARHWLCPSRRGRWHFKDGGEESLRERER